MSVITIGLESIGIGPIAGDGGMGTSLEVLGYTEQDTATLTIEAAERTDFIPEEIDDAIHSQLIGGAKTFAFTIMDAGPETMKETMGGTLITTGTSPNEVITWHAPDAAENIERSLKITPRQGIVFEATRVSLSSASDSVFSKNGLFTLNVEARVLKPKKTGESSLRAYLKPA